MKMSFIGIGAQKCASTWVSDMLRSHPAIGMPDSEPLDFFSYGFENGFRWYESQIEPSRPPCRGEVSQSYFHEPGVVERVSRYRSDLKIIVSLRDPVERALSQHRHLVRLGRVPEDDLRFETALATNPTYREQGLYYKHLSRWMDVFPPSLVHVILMDDIQEDPEGVARNLYRFLEVSELHQPDKVHERSNESYIPRSRTTEAVTSILRHGMNAVGAKKLWRILGDTGLRSLYRRMNRRPSVVVIPEPSPEVLNELRRSFKDDIDALSSLIDRDLNHWKCS